MRKDASPPPPGAAKAKGAEYAAVDDFLAGGQARLEGKNYVIEDGDVLNIRFNV